MIWALISIVPGDATVAAGLPGEVETGDGVAAGAAAIDAGSGGVYADGSVQRWNESRAHRRSALPIVTFTAPT